jgi:hypothetical protein
MQRGRSGADDAERDRDDVDAELELQEPVQSQAISQNDRSWEAIASSIGLAAAAPPDRAPERNGRWLVDSLLDGVIDVPPPHDGLDNG